MARRTGKQIEGMATLFPDDPAMEAVASSTTTNGHSITQIVPALAGAFDKVCQLSLASLRVSRFQPRTQFDAVDELADAIKQQGFTSVILVRPASNEPGAFEIIYGERRLRAAQKAGLNKVPCAIADVSDADAIAIALSENIQRESLSPLDEAHGLQRCIEEHGYSLRTLAARLGIARGRIENRLALLTLQADVQEMVARRHDTIDAARQIDKLLDQEVRQHLISMVLGNEISSRNVRRKVEACLHSFTSPQHEIAAPQVANNEAGMGQPTLDEEQNSPGSVPKSLSSIRDVQADVISAAPAQESDLSDIENLDEAGARPIDGNWLRLDQYVAIDAREILIRLERLSERAQDNAELRITVHDALQSIHHRLIELIAQNE